MKCTRLQLHERSKPMVSAGRHAAGAAGRPRRFCQKRLVDPAHEEDPRWTDLLERFHYNASDYTLETLVNSVPANTHKELFLSVQNLKFDGDVQVRKQPKIWFKYKALSDGKKHRMFVKQVVAEEENNTDGSSSQLTCYYFDDYVKYIPNNEQSVPTSERSSLLFCALNNKVKENKGVGSRSQDLDLRKYRRNYGDSKSKGAIKELNETVKDDLPDLNLEDTKVVYHKCGKRKCLTISRAQSPETIQVIRVDVVCNYSLSSTISESDDNRRPNGNDNQDVLNPKLMDKINMNKSHFSNKYLLTNPTKTLDENVSGGKKVTLLCKSFRLSRRIKPTNKENHTNKNCYKN